MEGSFTCITLMKRIYFYLPLAVTVYSVETFILNL